MVDYELLVITLTPDVVDSVKLAVLDVATNVAPGFTNGTYVHQREGCFGCAVLVKFTSNGRSKQDVTDTIEASLAKRGVQFLGIRVSCTKEGAIIGGGTLKRSVTRADSPYREQG